ncbi:MAG: succinyldiaminopimelate transaminase [Pseudomonadota bacterium]
MNPDLNRLQDYPFQRLTALLNCIDAPAESDKSLIKLSIGEPKHPAPSIVLDSLRDNASACSVYPKTKGTDTLRATIATWLTGRFQLNQVNSYTQVLPVTGTREAIFSFAQAVIDRTQDNPLVLSPNPFYQIYEGAALLAGASLELLPCTKETGYQPDFNLVSEQQWIDCQLLYICSPGNPTGAVLNLEQLTHLIELSDKYDFIIASDECYSEVYLADPPPGLLQACAALGRNDYKHCVVFHSLSKRSNVPGLRSGFIAGDENILSQFLTYRTYHGCAMSEMTQAASVVAWGDEQHCIENRRTYVNKFNEVCRILGSVCHFEQPTASFYIWLPTAVSDVEFASRLYAEEHIIVLPGSFLSRSVNGSNPGENHVRLALVAEPHECIEAAERIKTFIERNQWQTV